MNRIFYLLRYSGAFLIAVFLTGCGQSSGRYLAKGNQLYAAGKFEDASLNYQQAIQKDPRYAEAYRRLGLCYFAQGQIDMSVSSLTQANTYAPNDLGILEDLADVSYNRYLTNQRPEALHDSVSAMVASVLKQKPDSAAGLRLQASFLLDDGRVRESLAYFEKANRVSPGDPAVMLPYADALQRDNQPREAERMALDLIARVPSFAPAYQWLGDFYIVHDRQPDAEKLFKDRIRSSPKDLSAAIILTAFYQNQQRHRDAEDEIQSILSQPGNYPDCFLAAGDFYTQTQNWPAAEHAYLAGVAADAPRKYIYLRKLAATYVSQNRAGEALERLNQVLAEKPADWDSHAMKISVLLATHRPEDALTAAQSVIARRPNDPRFSFLIAQGYQALGEKQKAEAFFETASRLSKRFSEPRIALAEINKARKNADAVARYTEEILAVTPDDRQARMLHAWASIYRDDFPSANLEMKALAADYPNAFDVQFQTGLLYIAQRRVNAAVDLFGKMLESHPGDPRILAGLATAYFQGRSSQSAAQLVDRELAKNPSSEATRAVLAALAERLGKPTLAIQQYKLLCETHPESAEYRFELGKLYEFTGDRKGAVSAFEEAARLAPDDAIKQGRLALAYYTAGMIPQADAAYIKSLTLSPADPVLLNNRAYFLAETGNNPDEALKLARAALAKTPGDPAVLDTVALTYIKKNNQAGASEILRTLVLDYPNEPMFRYHLAMALLLAGDREAAKKELETGLTKHPSDEDRARIRALLGTLT